MSRYQFNTVSALSLVACLAMNACGGGSGSGEPPQRVGTLDIKANATEFKADFDQAQRLQLTVTNTGPVAVTDLLPTVSGVAVTEVGNTCKSIVLDAVANCTLSYLVKPAAPGQGALALDLQFADNGVVRHASLRIPYDFAASQWVAVPAWGNHQGNAAHSGYVPVSLKVDGFKLAWKSTAARATRIAGFASDKETIYVTTWRDRPPLSGLAITAWVQAVSVDDGSIVWQRELGSNMAKPDAPAVMDGDLFVAFSLQAGSYENWSWRLDAKTGDIKAKTRLDTYAVFGHMLPVIGDQKAYHFLLSSPFSTESPSRGRLFAHDTRGPRWSGDYPASDGLTPAVDAKYVYAYLGDDDGVGGSLRLIDSESGDTVFSIYDPGFRRDYYTQGNQSSLVLDERSTRAFAILNQRVVAFDLARQGIAWEQDGYSGQASYADETVFVKSADGRVLNALSAGTGALLWTWSAPDSITSDIIVTKTHVFVATEGTSYAIDRASHQPQWRHEAGGRLMMSNSGTLIISAGSGLTAISLR